MPHAIDIPLDSISCQWTNTFCEHIFVSSKSPRTYALLVQRHNWLFVYWMWYFICERHILHSYITPYAGLLCPIKKSEQCKPGDINWVSWNMHIYIVTLVVIWACCEPILCYLIFRILWTRHYKSLHLEDAWLSGTLLHNEYDRHRLLTPHEITAIACSCTFYHTPWLLPELLCQ